MEDTEDLLQDCNVSECFRLKQAVIRSSQSSNGSHMNFANHEEDRAVSATAFRRHLTNLAKVQHQDYLRAYFDLTHPFGSDTSYSSLFCNTGLALVVANTNLLGDTVYLSLHYNDGLTALFTVFRSSGC